MKLQDVPDKVFEDKLFQHLDWNDLLRLRRVCSWTKKITDAYLKANPDRAPELEINEEKDKSFGTFLEMGIPTTKLFINNPTLGYRFYEDDKVGQFLEDYGPLIKDLRVTQITLTNGGMCREKEFSFMEGLSNLKSLEVGYCSSGMSGEELKKRKAYKDKSMAATQVITQTFKNLKVEHWDSARSGAELEVPNEEPLDDEDIRLPLVFPTTFKKLEKVKIGRDAKDTDVGVKERKMRTRGFLMQCTRLKSICFPTCWLDQYPEGTLDTNGTIPGDLIYLVWSFEERPNELGFEQKLEANLELVDFANCHEGYGEWLKESYQTAIDYNWYGSQAFLTVCQKGRKTGLKLANVSPYWFFAKDSLNTDGTKGKKDKRIGEQVVSLVGLNPIIMNVKMPNLEKITIPSTKYCVTGEGKRPEWPSLKIFDITVDGNAGSSWEFEGATTFEQAKGICNQATDNVFAFLFCDIVRPTVTEFRLKFTEEEGKGNSHSAVPKALKMEKFSKKKDQIKWGPRDQLSVPNTVMIVKCCPNLKVVKLGNWQGSNQALLAFWNGLGETLEEVELENCGNVTDFAFFGKDEDKPMFLKLKNLKKLALKGIDKMSNVTDLLFKRILSQMKLKQLVLTSEKPLEKITKDGIGSLLEGPFAESIERFPFQGWSLANVTPQEFEEMGKKFRSYYVL